MKNNNFLSFLMVKFDEKILCKVKEFLVENLYKNVNLFNNDIVNINDVKNVDLNYKQVWIDSKDNNKIDFDIVVEVDADVNAYNRKLKEQCIDSIRLLVLVKCGGDLSIKLKDFRIYGVEDYVMSKPEKPMSGDMVPIIFRNEYEKYGEEILKKYYPEGLVSDKPIDKKTCNKYGVTSF